LHGSRLPQDRGGGGFSWRILRGDKVGVSLIHQIGQGIDTGGIIDYRSYVFPENCKIPIDYYRASIQDYLEFVKKVFSKIINEEDFTCTRQPEYLSTYWPRLATDIHGYIDWSYTCSDIEKFIHAFDEPYKGALTCYNDEEVRLKGVSLTKSDGSFHPFQSGIIYRNIEGKLFVACNDGSLIITRVVNDKGVNIAFKLRVGDRFYTKQSKLEEALQYRATYTPSG
jgi:methionyl-tRNA formyltransferase